MSDSISTRTASSATVPCIGSDLKATFHYTLTTANCRNPRYSYLVVANLCTVDDGAVSLLSTADSDKLRWAVSEIVVVN